MPAIKTKWRTQFVSLENNSDFHNSVGKIFREDSFFKLLKCYQEVPVVDLIPDYPFASHRYDWYIEQINTIVELHGKQHYVPTSWGNQSYEQIQSEFRKSQERDSMKKEAAINNGYRYVEISYKHYGKLNSQALKQLILG